MPLLNANGHPFPPSEDEAKARQERITGLLAAIQPLFVDHPGEDVLLVGINLLVSFATSGGPLEHFPKRVEIVLGNLQNAMTQAARTVELNLKVRASMDAANQQGAPS